MDISVDLKFSKRQYKSFLNRIKKLSLYVVAVGILPQDGKIKIKRTYIPRGKNKAVTAGKSHTMTLAKLAYQNEFGAEILIKEKYIHKTEKNRVRKSINGARVQISTVTKYSALSSKQGYVLCDKQGKMIALFPVGKTIKIPSRSFLRRTVRETDNNLSMACTQIMYGTLIKRSVSPKKAIDAIGKLVTAKVKRNIVQNKPNHPVTVKAKGKNTPLIDEQNRIYKHIKYKVFNNPYQFGTKVNQAYLKMYTRGIDKLLKSADVFTKKAKSVTQETSLFKYKIPNLNFLD